MLDSSHANGLSITSREVMRGFLRSMGWRREDCISLDVGADPKENRERAATDFRDASFTGEEPLLLHALLLDTRSAPAALLRSVLPEWLLARNALACLLMGRALAREGMRPEAEKMLRRALDLSEMMGAAYRELGLLLQADGRLGDAASAFQSALAMRRRIAFDGTPDSSDPVLVAQPNETVDIFYYAKTYYVVPRDSSLVGARAIAGELFAIRRNANYEFARQVARVPLIQRMIRTLGRRTTDKDSREHASMLPLFVRRFGGRGMALARQSVRRAALALFAQQIEKRAATLMDAIDLAEGRIGSSRPSTILPMSKPQSAHESLRAEDDVKVGSDRSFGIVFAVFCAIVAGIQIWIGSGKHWPWLGAAAAFAVVALALPRILHPLNVLWFKFGMLLHHIVTPIVLGLMFYTVFTPIGLWMRLIGKRPLGLRFDAGAKSYWVERKPPGPPPESFNNQF